MPIDPSPPVPPPPPSGLSGGIPPTTPQDTVRRLASVLGGGRFWMGLLGWALVVVGILDALSIVGLLFAWLLIWMGIVLIQATGRIAEAERSGETEALAAVLAKIRLYFTVAGVALLVAIVLTLIGVFFFASFFGGMMSMYHMHPYHY